MSVNYESVKELAGEFKGQFECLGEKTEKYNFFKINRKKLTNDKTVTQKIQFINSVRFMVSSLSSPANNLAEVFHEVNAMIVNLVFNI